MQLGLADLGHRVEAVDDRHGALVEVVEGLLFVGGGLLVGLRGDELRGVRATLHGHLGEARQLVQVDHVTDDVDVVLVAHGEVLVDGHAATAVGLDAVHLVGDELAQRGRGNAGGPDLGKALDGGLVAVLGLVGHRVLVDVGDHRVEADGHAGLLQGALGLAAEALAKRRQDLRRSVQQVDLGGLGAELGVLLGQRAVGQLGDLAGQLHAGRAGSDDDEGQKALALGRVIGHLCLLEGGQDGGADLQGVIQRLHARGELGEVVVAEVGLVGASGDDEGVVGDDALGARKIRGDGLAVDVDVSNFAVDEVGVVLAIQQLADGGCDVRGGDQAGGDLVEHRLEQVVILLVDDRDIDIRVLQLLNGRQAAEASADHNDVVAITSGTVSRVSHDANASLTTFRTHTHF